MKPTTKFDGTPNFDGISGTPFRILEKMADGTICDNDHFTHMRRYFVNRRGEVKTALADLEQRNCIKLDSELNSKTGYMGPMTVRQHPDLIRLFNNFLRSRNTRSF